MNGSRRHLTKSQLAIIAGRMLPLLEAEAKERQRQNAITHNTGKPNPPNWAESSTPSFQGESREKAAAMVGIGHNAVSRAKKLLTEAPELAEQVASGEKSLNQAYTEHTEPPQEGTTTLLPNWAEVFARFPQFSLE